MKDYQVTIRVNEVRRYEVKAPSEDAAKEIVMSGEISDYRLQYSKYDTIEVYELTPLNPSNG